MVPKEVPVDVRLLTARQVAEAIGYCYEETLLKLKAGEIPGAFRTKSGRWRVRHVTLRAWVRDGCPDYWTRGLKGARGGPRRRAP